MAVINITQLRIMSFSKANETDGDQSNDNCTAIYAFVALIRTMWNELRFYLVRSKEIDHIRYD